MKTSFRVMMLSLALALGACTGEPLPQTDAGDPDACWPTGCEDTGCPSGQAMCNGRCRDIVSNPSSCGSCTNSCWNAFRMAESTCAGGVCVLGSCTAGFANCDGNDTNGCETRLDESPAHCGGCGRACAAGQGCAHGTCGVLLQPGMPCTRNADCGPGGVCELAAWGFPGGYCVTPCRTTADCDSTGTCVRFSTTSSYCARSCAGMSAACREGYTCWRVSYATSICWPSCMGNDRCGPAHCDSSTHLCTSGICMTSAQCSPGSICNVASHQCECTADTRCLPGMQCSDASRTCGCATDEVCGPDYTCDRSTGHCIPRT